MKAKKKKTTATATLVGAVENAETKMRISSATATQDLKERGANLVTPWFVTHFPAAKERHAISASVNQDMEERTVQRGWAVPQNLARMEARAKSICGSRKVQLGYMQSGKKSDATTALLSFMVPFAKKKTTATATLVGSEENAETRTRTSSATASQDGQEGSA